MSFLPLRALVAATPAPPPIPPDPVCNPLAIALAHVQDCSIDVRQDRHALRIRVFLADRTLNGSHRAGRAREAQSIREIVRSALTEDGFVVRFTDAVWCARPTPGWDVIARANPRANATALS